MVTGHWCVLQSTPFLFWKGESIAIRHLVNGKQFLFILFCLMIDCATCCLPFHVVEGDVWCAQQVESTPKDKAAESEAAAAAAREAQMRAQQENQRRKEKAAERKHKANQKKKAREAEIKAQEAAAKAEVTALAFASAVAALLVCGMNAAASCQRCGTMDDGS